MDDGRNWVLPVMWAMSIAAAALAGWLVFGPHNGGFAYHAGFLIFVGAAVYFSIRLLSRLGGPGSRA
mgnify:CR=1 FL=1